MKGTSTNMSRKVNRRHFFEAISIGAALAPILSFESGCAAQSNSNSQDAGTAKLIKMDPNISFTTQIARNTAPVVLLSIFLVKPEYVEEFLSGFQKQFAIMRKQPGLISGKLHRGIAGSCLFMNHVIWESTDASAARLSLMTNYIQVGDSTIAGSQGAERI